MSLETVNLTDHIGSEIRTAVDDLLRPGVGEELRRLLVERGVLVFKELHPSEEQQLQLARSIGQLREELGKGIFKITLDKNTNSHADYLKGSFLWHIDGTHDTVPPFATLLTGCVLSATGGQTEFANSYAAYEALPDTKKQHIENLQVVHRVETSMRRASVSESDDNLAYWRSFADMTHSLVWTHKSGRKSLVVGCHADHIVGMERAASDALIEELIAWTTQPRFTYRHEWSPGDMIIWDNTGVLHRAEPYPLDSGRIMNRSTLLGEEAFS